MIVERNEKIAVRLQCMLLNLNRSKIYYCNKKPGCKLPFLLKNKNIYKPNQVWSTDISYIKMNCGFVYLASIIDVFSRKILGYQISNVVDSELW